MPLVQGELQTCETQPSRALRIDRVKREVWLAATAVNLSSREFDLLDALVTARGKVLTRDFLERRLYAWGQAVESNTIEVHVHNLRKKIGKEIIQTVRGTGYQIKQT
jgi:two-component system, OmpR family, response regulator QseB